jgi:hypothetical protein
MFCTVIVNASIFARVKPNDNVTESQLFSQMIMLPNGLSFRLEMNGKQPQANGGSPFVWG